MINRCFFTLAQINSATGAGGNVKELCSVFLPILLWNCICVDPGHTQLMVILLFFSSVERPSENNFTNAFVAACKVCCGTAT